MCCKSRDVIQKVLFNTYNNERGVVNRVMSSKRCCLIRIIMKEVL